MQFLVLFMPVAAAVIITGLHANRADLDLLRRLRARYPDILNRVWGRPRRWYDALEEMEIRIVSIRRRLFRLLRPVMDSDPELADLVRRSERAQRAMAWATAAGMAASVVLLVLVRAR
jgi:hypothetical protein